jgi:hypothetical protein
MAVLPSMMSLLANGWMGLRGLFRRPAGQDRAEREVPLQQDTLRPVSDGKRLAGGLFRRPAGQDPAEREVPLQQDTLRPGP